MPSDEALRASYRSIRSSRNALSHLIHGHLKDHGSWKADTQNQG
jgi:hypothetical protein